MPTYEYACKVCGQHLEVVQSFMDNALVECPACGGTLRKVFGNIGIAFKGTGFYRTDSRSERKASQKSADVKPTERSDAATKAEGGSSAKADVSTSSGTASSAKASAAAAS